MKCFTKQFFFLVLLLLLNSFAGFSSDLKLDPDLTPITSCDESENSDSSLSYSSTNSLEEDFENEFSECGKFGEILYKLLKNKSFKHLKSFFEREENFKNKNDDLIQKSKDLALTYSAGFGWNDFVKFFLENGANPNVKLEDETPLILMLLQSFTPKSKDCIKLLIENGASPEEIDDLGYYFLMILSKPDQTSLGHYVEELTELRDWVINKGFYDKTLVGSSKKWLFHAYEQKNYSFILKLCSKNPRLLFEVNSRGLMILEEMKLEIIAYHYDDRYEIKGTYDKLRLIKKAFKRSKKKKNLQEKIF